MIVLARRRPKRIRKTGIKLKIRKDVDLKARRKMLNPVRMPRVQTAKTAAKRKSAGASPRETLKMKRRRRTRRRETRARRRTLRVLRKLRKIRRYVLSNSTFNSPLTCH